MKTVLIETFKAWIAHRANSKGAALAFYTLFSMTPILILVIAVAGYFLGEKAANGEIISQIQGLVGPNGAQAIQALLAAANDQGSGIIATLVASALLLIGATSVFVELKNSLDDLWGIKKAQQAKVRTLLKTQFLCFGIVLFLAFLLLVSLLAGTVLAVLETYAAGILGSAVKIFTLLSSLISLCVIMSLFAVIFKMLPDAPLSWSDAWVGAVFTTVLFNLGKYAIGLYLGHSAIASSFGAAGSLIALLVWIYYSAQIFFFGAEFTRQYALRFGSLRDRLS